MIVDPALWVETDLSTECRSNHVYIADRAILYELNHALDLRVAAIHKGFHQEHIVFTCCFDHRRGFGVVHADRFLDEDVLAGFGALYRPFGVEWVDCRDIDGIDLLVLQQLLVAGVLPGDTKIVDQSVHTGLCAARYRADLAGVCETHRVAEDVGDAAGTHDAPV